MVFYLSITILVLALGAQLTLRSLAIRKPEIKKEKFFRRVFYASIFLIFISAILISIAQYVVWKNHPVSKFLLPPYQGIGYFFRYSIFWYFAAHIISLLFSAVFIKLAKRYNQKFEEKFFYPEEYYLGALAIFLSSFPGSFIYIIFLFLTSILSSLILNKFSTLKGERMSFYYLWIPVAIFVIIISKYLQQLPIWQLFKL